MIVHGVVVIPPSDGRPMIVANERAQLDCGCAVVTGLRTDTKEPASAAKSCSPEHATMMARVVERQAETIDDPEYGPLSMVEAADRILNEVAEGG